MEKSPVQGQAEPSITKSFKLTILLILCHTADCVFTTVAQIFSDLEQILEVSSVDVCPQVNTDIDRTQIQLLESLSFSRVHFINKQSNQIIELLSDITDEKQR